MATELEWLEQAPSPGLLESDIRSQSFNLTAWTPDRVGPTIWKSDRLVLDPARDPFEGLNIDTTPLDSISARSTCPKCQKSRKYYCYSCYIPLSETVNIIPTISSLPIEVDIIKHPHELDGKSSAIHAKVVCQSSVRVFTYPDIPDFGRENVLVLFPGPKAKTLRDYFPESLSLEDKKRKFQRVVFIDCTWHQVKRICLDERIRVLPQLMLDDRQTIFWRNQKGKPKEYLATIEAIYYFLHDYHTKVLGQQYNGEYDGILFLFKFMHRRLHEMYQNDP